MDGTGHTGAAAAPARTVRVGAVTHGLQLDGQFPAWVGATADALRQAGYDAAISFDWAALSNVPSQGMAALAGQRLAAAVANAVRQILPQPDPGVVVVLHLIGHSRGAVVISQAVPDLQALVQTGALPQLQGGRLRLTFLDPHPAHNTHSFGVSSKAWYSAADGPLGRVAVRGYLQFQDAARDPEVAVPGGAVDVEVYYQHASHLVAPDFEEQILNLWGEVPVPGASARYCDLTGVVNGHFEVHDWYLQQVAPTLGTAFPFACPGSTVPPAPALRESLAVERAAAPPSAGGAAHEFQALYPAVVDDRAVAIELLRRHAAADSALREGRTAAAAAHLTALSQFLQAQRGRHIAPAAVDFLEDKVRSLLRGLRPPARPADG
jgi:hypothetical protein